MTWTTAIASFATYQQAAGRSPGTINLYRYRLYTLADHAPTPAAVTPGMLLGLLANPEWKPETRKSVRTSWRSFFRWAVRAGVVDADPTIDLPQVTIPAGVPRPAPEHVVRRALDTDDHRLVLMVLLAAHGGLRACEIARVHSRDLDGDLLHVVGKGKRERYVPVSGDLLGRLQELDGWAFPTQHARGGPITAAHVSVLLSRGLPDGWTAHTLRHRMASAAYAGSGDLLAVQQMLGHSRPETTQRYVLLSMDRVRAAAAAAAA